VIEKLARHAQKDPALVWASQQTRSRYSDDGKPVVRSLLREQCSYDDVVNGSRMRAKPAARQSIPRHLPEMFCAQVP